MIPYGRQEITQDDIDSVVAVLRSDFLTQGGTVPLFETAVAEYCGAGHAVAVNSATSSKPTPEALIVVSDLRQAATQVGGPSLGSRSNGDVRRCGKLSKELTSRL